MPDDLGVWYNEPECQEVADLYTYVSDCEYILQTARIYSGASSKAAGWRSAVGLYCKFNRRAV